VRNAIQLLAGSASRIAARRSRVARLKIGIGPASAATDPVGAYQYSLRRYRRVRGSHSYAVWVRSGLSDDPPSHVVHTGTHEFHVDPAIASATVTFSLTRVSVSVTLGQRISLT